MNPFYAYYMRFCFYVLPALVPSLPGTSRDGHRSRLLPADSLASRYPFSPHASCLPTATAADTVLPCRKSKTPATVLTCLPYCSARLKPARLPRRCLALSTCACSASKPCHHTALACLSFSRARLTLCLISAPAPLLQPCAPHSLLNLCTCSYPAFHCTYWSQLTCELYGATHSATVSHSRS